MASYAVLISFVGAFIYQHPFRPVTNYTTFSMLHATKDSILGTRQGKERKLLALWFVVIINLYAVPGARKDVCLNALVTVAVC